MKMIRPQDYTVPGEIQRSPNRILGFLLHVLLPLAALACGVAITVYLMKTPPEAQPRKKPPVATLVEVRKVQAGMQPTIIHAMGEIIAARAVELKPRVGGEVIEVDTEFVPGGYFQGGETMLKLDPADYALVIRQLESEAANAESDLALEMGNQQIAQKEFAILNEQVSPEERSLILRRPQLDKLKASLDSARARLAQARLNLARTNIEAPFNSVIESRNVDTGAKVTESTVLANLVGTDTFWLRLTVPVEQLQWVNIPASSSEVGSTVRIFTQGDGSTARFRTGQVVRLTASLEAQGRMAQLLVKVDDPLSRKTENRNKPRLLLGSYVRAEIEGTGISSGFSIDRADIHDGNQIWLMDDEGRLDIRPVDIVFRNRDQVIVREGLAEGERLITSALASPIAGIPLRLAGEGKGAGGPELGLQRNSELTAEGVHRAD